MPIKNVNYEVMDDEVRVFREKDMLRIVTKALREFAKDNGINQYRTSVNLLFQFHTLISIYNGFIRNKKLVNEFFAFLKSLSPDYVKVVTNWIWFKDEMEEKLPIKLGV